MGLFGSPFIWSSDLNETNCYGFWGLEVYLGANKPANHFPPTLCCVLHWRPVAVKKNNLPVNFTPAHFWCTLFGMFL